MEIGVDIGGTFTDVVGWDGRHVYATKVSSTPNDPVESVRAGVEELLRMSGARGGDVRRFVHGTTVATNAALERKGARIGLLTTKGFEDVLEIGRQKRSSMYDLFMDPQTPTFLVPRRRRIGITERMNADGSVHVPLDEGEVEAVAERLVRDYDVEAVAVCYLFSFVNPVHELRTREVIAQAFPRLMVSLSCEVDPVFREYERTCVTAFDAYLRPKVVGYVGRLASSLRELGANVSVEMMQSRGGVASAERAIQRPVGTLLCGPAAGVLGGKVAGERAGFRDLVTLDMGGTSLDISIIRGGRLVVSRESRIGGYPLRIPMVDVHTIGAGGGSIARVDEAGALKVGPESAGADPGPACYGRGSTRPTVTDASVVLGYVSGEDFAGNVRLDPAAAENAVGSIAEALGMTLTAAAYGIHTVCNALMADAIRMVTVRRGLDPRDFALVALGGAGPVSGAAIALALGIRTLIVPPRPGVLAAEGLLHARIELDAYRTYAVRARDADAGEVEGVFSDLEAWGRGKLASDGIPAERIQVLRAADMRYYGQSYDLEVPLPRTLDAQGVRTAVDAFRGTYRNLYGHGSLEDEAEFVNLKVVLASEVEPPPPLPPPSTRSVSRRSVRRVCFAPAEGYVEVPVYERQTLPFEHRIDGPAIIAQPDSTTVLYPGNVGEVDSAGNLVVKIARDQ